MVNMPLKDRILESPLGYALWSAPLNQPKVEAIRLQLKAAGKTGGRFLDIGCGPGSNSKIFGTDFDYLGIDINPAYIAEARCRYPSMKFEATDARSLNLGNQTFDVILMNSFLHHLGDNECVALMKGLLPVFSSSSIVIVQEPLVPEAPFMFAKLMMKLDRGGHFRALEHWRRIIEGSGFNVIRDDFYSIRLAGFIGWQMYSATLAKCA
jgi:trans-aconitate methyltransferase